MDREELKRKALQDLIKNYKGEDYINELRNRDEEIMPTQSYYNEGDYAWDCSVCDSEVEEGTNFCHNCGQRLIKGE